MDQRLSLSPCSDLSDAPSDITISVHMPLSMQEKLDLYQPSTPDDDAVKVLRETFRYLPADGRVNLVSDVTGCETDTHLKQLAESIVSGILVPLKAMGKKAQITPSPRSNAQEAVDSTSIAMTDPIVREQQRLRRECLQREGNRCAVSGVYNAEHMATAPSNVITANLEAAHVIPFALGIFKNENERQRIATIWTYLHRYFPCLLSRIGFDYESLNKVENVMMLEKLLHGEFGAFNWTLEATETVNYYTIKTFPRLPTILQFHLPANRSIQLKSHDGRWPLPDPSLLAVHAAIANILNATGRGEEIDRILRDYGESGGLSADGRTDVSQLLSVSDLAVLASSWKPNIDLSPLKSRSSPTMKHPNKGDTFHYNVQEKEN
ncbi:hypothetical protein ASPWEDRAFT_72238 [Aspergillus wentii DTO 134E9]|uniref:HNH nuclease domain-containing protein n=1 Tax=Aspergillus wentii DTO 134E9 TaxID=1073089 RepID=A0A1L9R8M2_ASPWE|nr:uncharacterized protein ASPWEDRAFT_72238 [Aspergillus wentii DTO 134E9]KAI9925089.1 hypothetical protein MW887_006497 [Aspergillus wentii]OJJ31270.1 hypothetical protein ASPWEDRAFT_72238 [Aspergillus wentii DTO 134E9]